MKQRKEEPTNGKAHQHDDDERRQEHDRRQHRPADDFVELDELHRSFWGVASESLQNFYDN